MADPITTTHAFSYEHGVWGELIYGTKSQIQALGIGTGLAFPGEPGCPRRRALKVQDPRGYMAKIEAEYWHGEGIFSVSIPLFSEHPRPQPMPRPYAPGVTKRECSWADEYRGTGEALAALGLIELNQLPGQPGMRKTRVRILPDGSVLDGPPTANCAAMRDPGAKEIERAGIGMFRVSVFLPEERRQQRREREKEAEREWEQQLRALPRPAPLTEGRGAILAREHLARVAAADTDFQRFIGLAVNGKT